MNNIPKDILLPYQFIFLHKVLNENYCWKGEKLSETSKIVVILIN